jgi:succinoglycan biosynthesis protein ExoW
LARPTQTKVAQTMASADGSTVAVIIPFFQRTPGLLLRAVRSALGQTAGRPMIFVVDDGSPIDPGAELAELSSDEQKNVCVLRQRNAGPGAARNTGLDAVPNDVAFVAFLDSDDTWSTDHLARALLAFDRGAEFYFSTKQPDFASVESIGHVQVAEDLFEYQGDLFDALLHDSPIATRTVVYRKDIGENHRFPTDFSFGEDIFHWMSLTCEGRKVLYSARQSATKGVGVGISEAAWGTPAHMSRLYWEYRFHWAVRRRFKLTARQTAWSRNYRMKLVRGFIASFAHLAIRWKPLRWRHVAGFIAVYARDNDLR